MEVEAVTHALRWIASRGDSQTAHAISFTDLISLLQTVKMWMYCPGHTGVKGNDRADSLAGKATLTSGLLLGGASDTTCGHKAKDITPSIAWRRKAWKEEALDDLPWRTREGHRQSDQHWNRFKGNVGGTSERRDGALRYRLQLNWTEQAIHYGKTKHSCFDYFYFVPINSVLFNLLSVGYCYYVLHIIVIMSFARK